MNEPLTPTMRSEGSAKAENCCNGVTRGGKPTRANRKLLIAGVLAAIAAGLFFQWESLVALGVGSILVSVLPCLVMCGLGICASRMMGRRSGCDSTSTQVERAAPAATGRSD